MHLGNDGLDRATVSRTDTHLRPFAPPAQPTRVPLFLTFVFHIEERDRRPTVSTWALNGAKAVKN